MIKRLVLLVITAILSILASDSKGQATFTALVDYEYEYEIPITISDDGDNSTLGISGSSSNQTPSPSSASRYRAAYICMDAQAMLCLGISTDVVPVYDPSNLIHLQVKLRDRNERRGTDFLKMRWEIDTIGGQIRLASANTLCITKMIGGPSKELVLRPCNPSSPSPLSKWDIPFSNTNDSDNSTSRSGALALRSNSNQCMTLIRCVSTSEGRCDPSVEQPFSGDSSSFNAPLLSGSFVKLAKCDYGLSQELQQVQDCAPGCTSVLLSNQICNPQCQNAACNWDNGQCQVLTDEPTASPTRLKTHSPVIKPTSSPSSSRPSRHPTTTRPSKVPTARPSQVPIVSLATHKPTSITSKPTNKVTSTPTTPTLSQRPEDLTLTPTTSPTQNVSLLSGLPADSTSYSSGVPWWAWLVLSLLLVFVLILVGLAVRDRRRRRQQEEDRRRGQQATHRMFLSEKGEIIDVELGMNPARPSHIPQSSSTSFKHNNQQLADPSGGYFFREAPPPIPPKMDHGPPMVTSVSSRPTMVSFDASSFIEDEEARRKRKEEEQEERAKKMARRSVMKLLDAMTELESAFEVADKMMGDDEIHATEEETADVQVMVEDSENDSPNNPKRVSGSTPLKKRSPQKHLSQMAKSEEQSLVKELRSRRLEQAIAKVEKAIGTLERKVTHEHMMIIDGNEQSFQSSVGGDLDSTVNSERSAQLQDPKSSSFSYIVSRSSRGATIA